MLLADTNYFDMLQENTSVYNDKLEKLIVIYRSRFLKHIKIVRISKEHGLDCI